MARAVHGGNVQALALAAASPEGGLVDASANLNPLGPPPWLDAAFNEGRRAATAYPDAGQSSLRAAASAALGIPEECVAFGNGADELMFALARAAGRRVHLVEEPGYAAYREAAEDAGCPVLGHPARIPPPAMAEAPDDAADEYARYAKALRRAQPDASGEVSGGDPGPALWLAAPNNPTGSVPAGYPELPVRLAKAFPRSLIIVDEAFIEFADGLDPSGVLGAAASLPNLVALRSMTKFWCVPGLRAGFIVACPEVIARVRAALPTWPLNCVAEAFARRAFAPDGPAGSGAKARREETRVLVRAERGRMAAVMAGLPGIVPLRSEANFYLVRVDEAKAGMSANTLADRAAALGVGLRRCGNFSGLGPEYLRVAVRTPGENERIAAALSSILGAAEGTSAGLGIGEIAQSPKRAPRRAKALMIQGTSSGAGKSIIAAAFCRIFRDEGFDVAPYKAQNMANNSAVTPNGLEIGRAQAVQAAACGLDPDPRMNPVLLKPESDRGSQVVLMGKPYARYSARDYYSHKEAMRKAAREAYDSLASERELIVLEGAGSPAEINLKPNDFVNMAAARHAGARVLIVGDIDRGGVFASFIGTVSTFTPAELALVSGFIVNKFRGDPALLGEAFAMTRDRTGFPVLGCVPMLRGLDIPDEDEPVVKAGERPGAELRIAVPRLRRVSNFTDLDAFAAEPDAAIVPVDNAAEFSAGRWDAVIIPGSKSTIADLAWLGESGLADEIVRYAAAGGAVAGICGGYQMLGERILDPDGVESSDREAKGLGLLPVVTSFGTDKALKRVKARWLAGDLPLEGYEIHHGRTVPSEKDAPGAVAVPVMAAEDGSALGYGAGAVWGSYLHGLFDADGFRRYFLNGLRARRGLAPLSVNAWPSLDARLGALAEQVRGHVDMATIRRELGL